MTDTLQNALFSIPPYDRETWVTMAMALKSELGEEGFDLWDSWSRQATDPKHGYKAADATAAWKSCKPYGGITIGSLYHLAREHGWQGEAPVARELTPEEKRWRAEEARREEEARHRAAERAAQVATRMLSEAELCLTHT